MFNTKKKYIRFVVCEIKLIVIKLLNNNLIIVFKDDF